MSYSTLGSALIAPMRATSSATKATSTLTLNKAALTRLPASTFKPKMTLVVGEQAPSTPPTAPKPPAAMPVAPPSDEGWSDWGTPMAPPVAEPSEEPPPFVEPSQIEPLAPPRELPWTWIALGLTATAFLGYAVFKRPMKPNRRRGRRWKAA
jgi:hypothetical protein